MNHPISHQTTHNPRGTERQTRPDLPPAPTVNGARKRSKPDQISHTQTGSGEAKSTRKCGHHLTASQVAGSREGYGFARDRSADAHTHLSLRGPRIRRRTRERRRAQGAMRSRLAGELRGARARERRQRVLSPTDLGILQEEEGS